MSNRRVEPKSASESCFVADGNFGRQPIVAPGQTVAVSIETTRCIGTVNPDGFLAYPQLHFENGTVAEKLLLTIRAQIDAWTASVSPRPPLPSSWTASRSN